MFGCDVKRSFDNQGVLQGGVSVAYKESVDKINILFSKKGVSDQLSAGMEKSDIVGRLSRLSSTCLDNASNPRHIQLVERLKYLAHKVINIAPRHGFIDSELVSYESTHLMSSHQIEAALW